MSDVVIMYSKWPTLNTTKTRIVEETSPAFARDLSMACLDDMVLHLSGQEYDFLFAMNTSEELRNAQKRYRQQGILTPCGPGTKEEMQSERMRNAFSQALRTYDKAILVPSDVPALRKEEVVSAFEHLDDAHYVLGPEMNGGVYLIGMRRPPTPQVFAGVRWSSAHSFDDLHANCGEGAYILPPKADLNTMHDVLSQRESIAASCPSINLLLRKHGYDTITPSTFINYDHLDLAIPVAMALIERQAAGGKELLVQLRHKPTIDPLNTGKIEVPEGLIRRYEAAHVTAEREALEETGLVVKARTTSYAGSPARIHPFACAQETAAGRSYLALAFICDVITGTLAENKYETRQPQWIPKETIKSMLDVSPERFFSITRPILQEYVRRDGL